MTTRINANAQLRNRIEAAPAIQQKPVRTIRLRSPRVNKICRATLTILAGLLLLPGLAALLGGTIGLAKGTAPELTSLYLGAAAAGFCWTLLIGIVYSFAIVGLLWMDDMLKLGRIR